jgi:rare lipoprotein A (peptidoglycan hydrolase)
MFRNAAITAYAGARTPTRRDLANLARYERCSRHPWARPVDRRIWARSKAANALRRNPFQTAIASWYEDGGATASGYHAAYGFASLILAFGTRVEFCYPPGSARCVVATDDDHGPYVGGRTFDLGQSTAGALGFGGVGAVAWRIMSAP